MLLGDYAIVPTNWRFGNGVVVRMISIPRFLDTPENTWVKCDETRSLPGGEAACLINGVERTRIVIVPSVHFDLVNECVRAVKVGTAWDDDAQWLVDFPSGERLLVSEELIKP